MEFEEMQVIWNEQTQEQMYVLDHEAVHASVRRRGRGIERGVNAMEVGMIVISIVTAVILAGEPLLAGIDRHQLVSAAVMLTVPVYLLVGRARRRSRESAFEPTLLGDLERALSQVDYHVMRARTMPLWFFGPSLLVLAIGFASKVGSKPLWIWPVCLAAFALGLYLARLELRCVHMPRKRDLEALREKLTAAH